MADLEASPPRSDPSQKCVLVVEDDSQVAAEVRHQLQSAGLSVLDPAPDGAEAVRRVAREHPDLVVIDLALGGSIGGLEAAERIRRMPPHPPVIFLAGSGDPALVARACDLGAAGYVIKPFQASQLVSAVMLGLSLGRMERQLRRDRDRALAVSRQLSERTVEVNPVSAEADTLRVLTRREREIVRLLASHQRPRAIGQSLDISYYTVKNHLKQIFRKLGVSSQTELLALVCLSQPESRR